MKKLSSVLLLIVVVLASAICAKGSDNRGVYVGIMAGLTHDSNQTRDKSGFKVASEVGYRFNQKYAAGLRF